jgi:hypothetical protein
MADIQLKKKNLDFLIRDSSKTYTSQQAGGGTLNAEE